MHCVSKKSHIPIHKRFRRLREKKIFKIPLTKLKTKLIVDKIFINKSLVYILKYAKPKKKKKKKNLSVSLS